MPELAYRWEGDLLQKKINDGKEETFSSRQAKLIGRQVMIHLG